MGLRLIPRSPRRRIPFASVTGGLKALANPVGFLKTSAGLTPATGARTTRLCRPRPVFVWRIRRAWYLPVELWRKRKVCAVRRRAAFAHEQAHPAKTCCAPGVPRPPLPAPNVRDDRDTPLLWARDGGVVGVIWGEREAEYFSREGWTGFSDLPVGQSHRRSHSDVRVCGGALALPSPIEVGFIRLRPN